LQQSYQLAASQIENETEHLVAPEEIRTEYGIDKNLDKNIAALNKKATTGGQNSRT
jgi:hypothetical protein